MTSRFFSPLAALLLTAAMILPLRAQNQETRIVEQSTAVLTEIMSIPTSSIPRSLLSDARGLVIIPNMVKGGFVLGVRHGKGVAVVKDESGAWRPPIFVTMTGGSVGWQVGLQATDVILVFRTQKSVQGLMNGKFTVGVDAAAAAGPVGRQAAAATDVQLKAEILSYSRSRGLFAGLSIDGSALQVDDAANRAYYYGTGMKPNGTVVGENAQLPPSAVKLLQQVAAYSASPQSATAAQPTGAATGTVATVPGSVQPAGQANPSGQAMPMLQPPPGSSPLRPPLPPPPGSTAAIEAENGIRLKLANASRQLQLLLDNNWKQFLALPTEVYQGATPPSIESLTAALSHYDVIKQNPQYAVLVRRPEFQTTHELLQRYLASRKSNTAGSQLVLPPPPAANAGAAPGTNGRY